MKVFPSVSSFHYFRFRGIAMMKVRSSTSRLQHSHNDAGLASSGDLSAHVIPFASLGPSRLHGAPSSLSSPRCQLNPRGMSPPTPTGLHAARRPVLPMRGRSSPAPLRAAPAPPQSPIIPGKPAEAPPPVPFSPLIPKLPVGPVVGRQLVEMGKRFKRLQNGSDVRGIAIEGEGAMRNALYHAHCLMPCTVHCGPSTIHTIGSVCAFPARMAALPPHTHAYQFMNPNASAATYSMMAPINPSHS